MIMNARRLLTGSMANMRELGGYTTADGHLTQYGRFIRSNVPERLLPEETAFLKDYGLKTVIDLRTDHEAAHQPSALAGAEGIDYRHISFLGSFESVTGGVFFSPADHYVPMVRDGNRIKDILSDMASAKEGAILFNCSAGKDRTGIIAALLLLIAGVAREDIVADYQVTFTYIKGLFGPKLLDLGRPFELCRSDPEWMENLLDYFDSVGGVESFLTSIGLGQNEIEKLRQRLIG